VNASFSTGRGDKEKEIPLVDRHIGIEAWSSSFSLVVASVKQAKA
jgi:hypothetical protein